MVSTRVMLRIGRVLFAIRSLVREQKGVGTSMSCTFKQGKKLSRKRVGVGRVSGELAQLKRIFHAQDRSPS